jgi:hypothetical protein
MTALFATVFATVGGLWRRMFGGWLGTSRVVLVVLSLLLIAPGLIWMPGSWSKMPLVAACWLWLWCDGHEWTDVKALAYRYGYPSACMAALSGYWACLLIGPLIAGGYWLVQRDVVARRLPRWGEFLDGEIAYAELWAGFVAALLFNLSGAMQ